MSELNVNDYVRTKDGFIRKIIEIDEYGIIRVDKSFISTEPEWHDSFIKDDIIKSSPRIIDLIEVGDYVNGCWVNEIKDGKPYHEDYNDPYYSYYIENEDIKSVVTHEQFENISYKVGE